MNAAHRSVFLTGAAGYLGTEVLRRLAEDASHYRLTGLDSREVPLADRVPGVEYLIGDIRDPGLADLLRPRDVQTVVHLASIVNPGGPAKRAFEHSVDVGGTQRVLDACVETGVRHLIVTSSGAAYGYHADNPVPLRESDPLRGNPEFPYADHKRQVEELLKRYRASHPSLVQLVFRPGTVLGKNTSNQITRLFTGQRIVGLAGVETPFVFISDRDVVECIALGIEREAEGIYNLAGDGTLTLRQIARITGKPYVALPVWLFRFVLRVGQCCGLTTHGPEQVVFLQYRPVLANDRLKTTFGYTPRMTSEEAFRDFWEHARRRS